MTQEPSQYFRVGGVEFGNPYIDPIDDGHETIEEAVEWCHWQFEDNLSSPSYIICPNGYVLGFDELYLLLNAYEKHHKDEVEP